MPDDANSRNATVLDTMEQVRSERFPDVDRGLVLEVLRLHADGVTAENVERQVDEAIAKRSAEVA